MMGEESIMRYRSAFDIIGPSMVGPSSSHTAGANRIGQLVRKLYGKTPIDVKITFYGSFAETYQGHGTDRAIIAGLMGMKTDDLRIRGSLEIADHNHIQYVFQKGSIEGIHPNSTRLQIQDGDRISMDVVGISLGGGTIEIIEWNGYNIRLSGDFPTLILEHIDQVGVIGDIGSIIAKNGINVSHMEVDRWERGGQAIIVIEMDEVVPEELLLQISKMPSIRIVRQLEAV